MKKMQKIGGRFQQVLSLLILYSYPLLCNLHPNDVEFTLTGPSVIPASLVLSGVSVRERDTSHNSATSAIISSSSVKILALKDSRKDSNLPSLHPSLLPLILYIHRCLTPFITGTAEA